MNLFKQVLGFDVEEFSPGTPVLITDNRRIVANSYPPYTIDREGMLPWDSRITGSYLVQIVYSDMIHVIGANGTTYIIPSRHFIGDEPDLTIAKFYLIKEAKE